MFIKETLSFILIRSGRVWLQSLQIVPISGKKVILKLQSGNQIEQIFTLI
jgi:hypothetical protein